MTQAASHSAVFTAWRESAATDWRAYTHHAFVTALGDGTLPRASFRHYLVQDYVFLRHFARAWALAVFKAKSLGEMRLSSATVHALINEEMALHIETCAAEGIDEATLFAAEEADENLAYTRFVLDAGMSGDLLDLLAALAPCVLGYGEIGLRLMGQVSQTCGPRDETYRPWIETYGGDAYQGVCRDVGKLLDDAAAARLGGDFETSPRWPELCRCFARATRLEVGFWDMGLRGHP